MTIDTDQTSATSNHEENLTNTDPQSPSFAWPTVVAVVVTHNPGDWLEQCLTSLNREEYPDLTTLVFDVASDNDLTSRVAASMPSAYVRRSDEDINFAQAINIALNSIEGATYVLICHDDIILEHGAIANMVEEAFRSNASIVGPKMIDAENPEKLLEVGGMIDRFGVPFSGIEPDEVDQGQHDGVRDVFFVSSAAMLVRADLFRALGGFDEQCFPGAEDIDLAWRAHLVGARVLVQPDAVIRHHKASDRQRKARTSARAVVARHRMRAVVKNSSKVSLAWILPLAFVLHTIEGIVWLLRADPRRSFLLFSGWIWNLRNLRDIRKARRSIQRTREVSDRDIAHHQIGGSARIRRFFTSLARNRQLNKITSASRNLATRSYTKRTSETPYFLAAAIIYLFAIRGLIMKGIPGVGNMTRWPEISAQISALLHGGLPVAEDPMYSSTVARVISIVLTALCGGNEGLAQLLFTVSLIPIGCMGVRLLMRDRDVMSRPNTVGAIVYGAFGVGVYSFSQGGIDTLILMATIPFFLRALSNRRIRQTGIVAGIMIALVPAAITLCAVLGAAFTLVGHQADRDFRDTHSPFGALLIRARFVGTSLGVAMLINAGWIFDALKRIDRSALGLSDASLSLKEYIFPNTSMSVFSYVVAAVTVCALIVCRNDRVSDVRVLTVSFGLLFAVSGFLVAQDQPLLDASVLMACLQLICALSVAVCIHSYFDEMKLRSFGIAHIATTLAIVATIVASFSSIWVLSDGSMGMPDRSWSSQVDVSKNARVLYIGDSRVLLGRSVLAPLNRSFLVSGAAQPTILSSRVGPASGLDDEVRDIYSVMMAHDTQHAGRLFARLSIEAIVVPQSIAPGERVIARDTPLLDALDSQTDLVRLRDRNGLIVYMNSSLETTFSLDARAQTLPLGDVLASVQAPEVVAEKQSKNLTTLIILFISITMFCAAIGWPRRHQLLKTSSQSFQKISSRIQADQGKSKPDMNKELDLVSEEDKEQPTIDLTKDHASEIVEEEATEVKS